MPVQGILLAAGYGRRFDAEGGQDKLLVPMEDGRPVLWHSARVLTAVLPDCLAVIRPGQALRARWLTEGGCRVLESPAAEAGMGSALAAAVGACGGASGWVVALADMPWLDASAVAAVAAGIDAPQRLVAMTHRGRRGHPVGFGSAWGEQLAALTGDTGARALLAGQDIRLIDWPDDSVLRDIDRPADLGRTQAGPRRGAAA